MAEREKLRDHPDPAIRWRHRRRMAYIAMLGLVLFPVLFVFTENTALAEIAWPVMATLGGVVGAYVGFSTWDTVTIARQER